jgi:hypothetical protein
MDTKKKVLIIVGLIGVAVGGFVLTKYLTRNTVHLKYSTINLKKYDTAPTEEPLTD